MQRPSSGPGAVLGRGRVLALGPVLVLEEAIGLPVMRAAVLGLAGGALVILVAVVGGVRLMDIAVVTTDDRLGPLVLAVIQAAATATPVEVAVVIIDRRPQLRHLPRRLRVLETRRSRKSCGT